MPPPLRVWFHGPTNRFAVAQTYVVAKTHDFDAPETFATQLAHFFLDKYAFVR